MRWQKYFTKKPCAPGWPWMIHRLAAGDTLAEIAAAAELADRVWAAAHGRPEIQTMLAHDPEVWMRAALAGNRALVAEIQTMLAHDPEIRVRDMLAGNPALVAEAQTVLAHDPAVRVRASLAGNRALVAEVQAMLAADDET